MSLSAPTTVFGLSNITLLNYENGLPLFIGKVPAELNIPLSMGMEKLFGGANKFILEAEPTYMQGEISTKFKQFNPELYSAINAASVTTVTAEGSTGAIVAATNLKGISVMNSVIGITSVAMTPNKTNDLKAGRYIIEAASATTVNVYAASDVDFDEGDTTMAYLDDTGKIFSATTITTGGAASVLDGLGVQLVGGSGTIGMTPGDTAIFDLRPKNISNSIITLGKSNITFPKVKLFATAQKKGTKEKFLFYAPKVQPFGFDVPLGEYKFAENAPKLILLFSATENMVGQFTRIKTQVD